ncbi:hypothetical protein PAHAL_6G039400 [Panicum hallii]|uniref:Knottin scorpion toxin-like domain-containing protein n=1 Tax=Panicum hallii TaxID=206008 RepID=A0A2S3I0C7_9POAL|nr:hypothetical protein PAHAL_6G039400 [Panicum hallii]
MAALLGNADARALLLAAIMVMAMVLSPADPAQAQDVNCIDLRGSTCDQPTCTRACKAASYVDPVVKCKSAHICCCFVKCCGGKRLAMDAVEPVD